MTAQPAAGVPRRRSGATRSLGSIVLGFQIIVVGLGTLAAFGLKVVEPVVAFVGGGIIIVGMIISILLLKNRVGIVLGWIMQVLVALTTFLVPLMGIVSLMFGGMWGYAMVKGQQLDKSNAEHIAALERAELRQQSETQRREDAPE